jgi:dynein heavy chain
MLAARQNGMEKCLISVKFADDNSFQTYAMREFIREKLGQKYVEARSIDFFTSYAESSNITPIFFILSPGVDPLKDVERVGKALRFSTDFGNFHNVSLGQGQEIVAENAIERAAKEGHWVILQVN